MNTNNSVVRYGVPYMGSKSSIAEWVVAHLPRAKHFYDVFAGGCAVTHCAMRENKYEFYHLNDISDAPQLFVDAIRGKYANEKRWISRAMFDMFKATDPYIRIVWSFGNNGRQYMYGKDIEEYKHAMHAVIFGETVRERQLAVRKMVRELVKVLQRNKGLKDFKDLNVFEDASLPVRGCPTLGVCADEPSAPQEDSPLPPHGGGTPCAGSRVSHPRRKWDTCEPGDSPYPLREGDKGGEGTEGDTASPPFKGDKGGFSEGNKGGYSIQSFQALSHLESCHRLNSLQSLRSLLSFTSLVVSRMDYRELVFEDDCVIYCDPPYKDTIGYDGSSHVTNSFDHAAFYDWCEQQTHPIFISEYAMPEDRFVRIAKIRKRVLMAQNSTDAYAEDGLFVPRRWQKDIKGYEEKKLF